MDVLIYSGYFEAYEGIQVAKAFSVYTPKIEKFYINRIAKMIFDSYKTGNLICPENLTLKGITLFRLIHQMAGGKEIELESNNHITASDDEDIEDKHIDIFNNICYIVGDKVHLHLSRPLEDILLLKGKYVTVEKKDYFINIAKILAQLRIIYKCGGQISNIDPFIIKHLPNLSVFNMSKRETSIEERNKTNELSKYFYHLNIYTNYSISYSHRLPKDKCKDCYIKFICPDVIHTCRSIHGKFNTVFYVNGGKLI